jgi:hypothetical protein
MYDVQSETAALRERQDAVTDILRLGGIDCTPRSEACNACGAAPGEAAAAAGGEAVAVVAGGAVASVAGGATTLVGVGVVVGEEAAPELVLPRRPRSPVRGRTRRNGRWECP